MIRGAFPIGAPGHLGADSDGVTDPAGCSGTAGR